MIFFRKLLLPLFLSTIFIIDINSQILPQDTLYNQAQNPSGNLQVSSHFSESGFSTTYSCKGADDFICPVQWTITKVFVLGGFYNGNINPSYFEVYIYADDNPDGNFPGSQVYYGGGIVQDDGNGGITIPLGNGVVLQPGHYWISVAASVALGYATWGWRPSAGTYNSEADWENPGDGFGTGYTTWTPITTVFQNTTETEYSFALFGINGVPASNPIPAENQTAVDLNQNLSWTNPPDAQSIEVSFGTNPNSLNPIYSGAPISTINQGTMNYSTDYYWRVDVNHGSGLATGVTWHFATMQDPTVQLNENFDSYGFPPDGWSLENSGGSLWDKYYGISAYGQGQNSVRCKFFLSAFADSISSLITYTFNQLPANDTLEFDYAYAATSQYFIDKLDVRYSTDSGQNWERLILMTGGPNGNLVTAPYTSFEFVPDSSQWETMKLAVPEGTNRIKFKAINGYGNDLFLDNIRILNVESVTPVELVSFNANAVNNKVELKWTTGTEANNKGFEIERKAGGAQLTVENKWQTIGFVEGNGTTTQQNNYSFEDGSVQEGKYHYRLKQIDFDGSFTYSNIVTINLDIPADYSLSQNFPNPFNPSTKINYRIAKYGFVSLKVFNVLGDEVKTLVNEDQKPGAYSVTFNASNLPAGRQGLASGIYFYKLITNNFQQVKKMILIK